MFQKIIAYSVENKLVVFLLVLLIVIGGVYSMRGIPLDAVPDITNNQVQVVTVSPTLAAEEVEQLITFPIESSISNLPGVVEIRSISRYGLSVITVVFEEDMPTLDSRQYVREQLSVVTIPDGLGQPELMPITTGLGEIYQYTLVVEPEYEDLYNIMDLRTIQDWIVKRQLAGIPGIIEVSSFGGLVKQYEVSINSERMFSLGVSMSELITALEVNNENSGGSYQEKGTNSFYIRTFGRLQSKEDIEKVLVTQNGELPVYVRDIATVKLGSPKRYGAMTMDGKGEVVGGITLMLKESNSSAAIANVQDRVAEIQSSLPEGVKIEPYLDRSSLISRAISTVEKNLIEGGIIVIFILVLLLGNIRGGLIVASVIPLSMLFAFMLMRYFGVSANLMSLGALDFGIVVDGAVIIVESVLHILYTNYVGQKLTQKEMDDAVIKTSGKIYNSAAFGVLIILVVFVPIMTLVGTEGKMFRPMAFTVSFAILGAMILSLTYVPMMASIFLKKDIKEHKTFSDKLVEGLRKMYRPTLDFAMKVPGLVIAFAIAALLASVFIFSRMGGEFIPNLEEGDMAMQMTIQPGSSLTQSIKTTTAAEKILKENFPEIKHVVSKIGTAEVPTDPMSVENADIMLIMKEKDEWVTTDNREDLVALMKDKLSIIVGASFDFTQPIQLRFNELVTGAKTDIAIQIFGENLETLANLANKTGVIVRDVQGVGDVLVEQTEGLPQYKITYDRQMMAQYGVSVMDLNRTVEAAYAGYSVGQIFENERQFDLVVRYNDDFRTDFDLSGLWVETMHGKLIPMSQVASVTTTQSPLQISRDQAKRRISVGVNVRNRDVASLVEELKQKLGAELKMPAGYVMEFGGQFENLEKATARLQLAVPLALLSIVVLLYFTFNNIIDSLIIFLAVPFSAIGGVLALWIRDMPFSISAGVGFIALFGVSVLNGIVLIQYYHQLQEEGGITLKELVVKGGLVRMRPVVMTAAVAALGFLPMAISTTAGAEVQRPLATVVIGGLVTSTLLTLIVLPVVYNMVYHKKFGRNKAAMVIVLLCGLGFTANAQTATSLEEVQQKALANYGAVKMADLEVQKQSALKKQSYDPGNLGVNVQYGEINAGVNDYNISITQSLGNIPKAISSGKAASLAVELAQMNQEMSKRWVKMEVSSAYVDWVKAGLAFQSLQSQLDLYKEVVGSSEKAVEAGDKSLLEVSYLSQQYSNLRNQVAQAKVDLELASQYLVELTTMERQGLSLPQELPIVLTNGDSVLSTVFYHLLDQHETLASKQLKTEKLGYFPGISVGYFNQQLEGVSGFQGVQFGASVPLWFRPQSARVQERKVVMDQVEVQNDMQMRQLQQSLNKCLAALSLIQDDFVMAQESSADQLDELVKQAQVALDAGELDAFDFINVVNQSYEGLRSALATQSLYLKTLIELNYYTE
ncbi:MAG: CusA/CzcA family heavy metal efflux RND transporter [Rickettsiales bacterium]|nr:CusA/CzcA family heavy metal efflux RND transporter [Rickettsiales bacterium]